MKIYLVLFLFVFISLVGCNELSENATIAKNYLISEGYEVISQQRDGWQEFSKSDLLDLPNKRVDFHEKCGHPTCTYTLT